MTQTNLKNFSIFSKTKRDPDQFEVGSVQLNQERLKDDLRNANVGDCCTAAKKDGPDVVDHYGLNPPVGVEDSQGAKDCIGDGGRVQERENHCRHLQVVCDGSWSII